MNEERQIQYISRKSMLRPTDVEYGDYAMNHVLGCSHGCKFPCYAYLNAKRFGQVNSYEEWCRPKLVVNTVDILAKEIPKLKDKIKCVNLCFTTDPFMYNQPDIIRTSMVSICRLNDAGIKCSTLTKGVTPNVLSYFPIAEAEQRGLQNEYGITLVSTREEFREHFEPGTAPYKERIEAIRHLHNEGCKTWVSIEPYPTPYIFPYSGFLWDVLDAVPFVDKIVFGRWNYNAKINKYKDADGYYKYCAGQVREFCREHNIECIIKKGILHNA